MISKRHRTEPEEEENKEEELKRKRHSKNQSCLWNLNFSLSFAVVTSFFLDHKTSQAREVKSETKTETEPKQEQVQKVCDGVCLCVFVSCVL